MVTSSLPASASSDGARLLVLRTPPSAVGDAYEAAAFHRNSAEVRPLPAFRTFLRQAILARSGKIAFLGTAEGNVFRMSVDDGRVEPVLVADAPIRTQNALTPGALASFTTVGADLLPRDNVEGEPPFGAQLAGYSVLLND
ncbi:MAG: hypothetical protein IT165_33285 [Bryobacterales bacterium]|nr:hypothetical protein [Bryobacterales bacterium]